MNLAQFLRLSKSPNITFVGAGGKTTALFQLARVLDGLVIVTATTHLGTWQIPLADEHIISTTPAQIEAIEQSLSGVVLVTGGVRDDRTEPLDNKVLAWLRAYCENHSLPLLIEADGSRQKPLKAPAAHEPAIPMFAEMVIQVVVSLFRRYARCRGTRQNPHQAPNARHLDGFRYPNWRYAVESNRMRIIGPIHRKLLQRKFYI